MPNKGHQGYYNTAGLAKSKKKLKKFQKFWHDNW